MQASEQALLILIVPLKLEELIVDKLLQETAISGFTSCQVNGHGSFRNMQLSLAEQVSGRQRRVEFMLHGELKVLQTFLDNIKTEFQGAGVHYMLQPLLAAGLV